MNHETHDTAPDLILERLTRTLLYEGYALYPYHRSAVKNQKPVPFGVVFPQVYHEHNEHARANMQTQCVLTGSAESELNVIVRFLHLKKIDIYQYAKTKENFIPVAELNINGKFYQAGWQTLERTVETGCLISQLIKEKRFIHFYFEEMNATDRLDDMNEVNEGRQISSVSEISGIVQLEAVPVKGRSNSFQITVNVNNTTSVGNAETMTRDEALGQSFLSTHIILRANNGEFISLQSPAEKWSAVIEQCQNINTYPILIDKANTTMLSSPIVLYDYPQINPHSAGDLFDSTEIEEALLLHLNMLSEAERERISATDEKLKAMFNKVSSITPEELMQFHSNLKYHPNGFGDEKM